MPALGEVKAMASCALISLADPYTPPQRDAQIVVAFEERVFIIDREVSPAIRKFNIEPIWSATFVIHTPGSWDKVRRRSVTARCVNKHQTVATFPAPAVRQDGDVPSESLSTPRRTA